jgi:hypothetical protein
MNQELAIGFDQKSLNVIMDLFEGLLCVSVICTCV